MLKLIKLYSGLALLGVVVFLGCPGPESSPMIPPAVCDHAVAYKLHSTDTCPHWAPSSDHPLPAYCTDAGTVVDGYTWCDSEVAE